MKLLWGENVEDIFTECVLLFCHRQVLSLLRLCVLQSPPSLGIPFHREAVIAPTLQGGGIG